MGLKWRQDGELHFAHVSYGFYMIEQKRGKFYMELNLRGDELPQDLGHETTLAKAKKEIERAHKTFREQLGGKE